MLIHFNFGDEKPVAGIVVAMWTIESQDRIMVIGPQIAGDTEFVDVQIIYPPDFIFGTIAGPTDGWIEPQTNGFGDDSRGYDIDKRTAENLYYVWDDGPEEHKKRAIELAATFKSLIEFYTPAAMEYLQRQYEEKLNQAKADGHDVGLIKSSAKESSFPYRYK